MHIILMLIFVILGLALSDKVSLIIGGPLILLGVACFNLGSKQWKNDQEDYFFLIAICCLVLKMIFN